MRRVAMAVVAAALVSCGGPTDHRTTIIEATVQVRAEGCGPRTEVGVGTSISDGLVITAAHVVAGAERTQLVDHLDATIDAEVVFFDPLMDVAALRPVTPIEATVAVRDRPAAAGDSGTIAITSVGGVVDLVDVEVVQRVTILTTDIYRDDDVERPGLRVAVDVAPGDSGAMVHLDDGGVGIVWSRSTAAEDRAWTVDLPDELMAPAARRAMTDAVTTGPCP